jgi:hypothetical protein
MDLFEHANPYDLSYHQNVRDFKVDEERYPFYKLVPKSEIENLQFRIHLQEAARDDVGLQQQLWQMCRRDTLFWLNAFCWLHEPRPRPRVLPFITWPHQDPCIADLESTLGVRDAAIDKSRGEGATWMALMVLLKYWLFGDPMNDDYQMFSFGLVSRNEDAVDKVDEPGCLMWKLDFQIEQLPFWMKPDGFDPDKHRKYSTHILTNPENRNTFVGYSATSDVASGGRHTAFLMDEMAKFPRHSDYSAMSSTQYVSDCRWVVSTFKGNHGAYYDLIRGQGTSAKVIVLDWKDNPVRNRGLYTVTHGNISPLSDSNPLPSNYDPGDIHKMLRNRGFQVEDKILSPWYVNECVRGNATPSSIAEELDRDPERSGSPFFQPDVLQRLKENCREPLDTGRLDFFSHSCEPDKWIHDGRGEWLLWCEVLLTGRPSSAYDFVMGIDVAAGGGGSLSSNSAISVANVTGQKVAEFASPRTLPQDLARIAYAAGHWFRGPGGPAYLIFESNGSTGVQFAKSILELEYPRLFLDEVETEISRVKQKKPGYWNQGERKRPVLYGSYRQALSDGNFSNPSAQALDECKFYEHMPGGGIEHVAASSKNEDASGAGHNHGDRATADALCWRGILDLSPRTKLGKPKFRNEPTIEDKCAPDGSFLARRNEWKKESAVNSLW